jgi:hypothetical protein
MEFPATITTIPFTLAKTTGVTRENPILEIGSRFGQSLAGHAHSPPMAICVSDGEGVKLGRRRKTWTRWDLSHNVVEYSTVTGSAHAS